MFYVVKSNTKSIKDKIITSLITSNEISNENIFVFDYDEKPDIESAFLEYLSLDLMGEKKAVIIKNADFLNKPQIDQAIENRFASTIMLTNENILILTVDKLNKTGRLRKRFESDLNIMEKDAPTETETSNFIRTFFENRNITIGYSEIQSIMNRSSGDFDMLLSELTKLELITDKEVKQKDIEDAILDYSRQRVYKICEYVATLNYQGVEEMIKQYRSEGESSYLVGEFLVREFSKLLKYKVLRDKGMSDKEIISTSGWKPWDGKNYSSWISNWRDTDKLKEFFYDVILNKCFLDLLINSPEDPINSLQKTLVANIIKYKEVV